MRLWVSIISSSEVPVVAGDDGVLLSLLDVLSAPLTNARTASIRQDQTTNVLQRLILYICMNHQNSPTAQVNNHLWLHTARGSWTC